MSLFPAPVGVIALIEKLKNYKLVCAEIKKHKLPLLTFNYQSYQALKVLNASSHSVSLVLVSWAVVFDFKQL